ncbi:MAG: hypothetical protein K0S61_1291 [Anaerocolumna sp.]|jgi:hypothetical protein|nr:hypothetical protein [Anaerocolumna sp.]
MECHSNTISYVICKIYLVDLIILNYDSNYEIPDTLKCNFEGDVLVVKINASKSKK